MTNCENLTNRPLTQPEALALTDALTKALDDGLLPALCDHNSSRTAAVERALGRTRAASLNAAAYDQAKENTP
jgi:hypothetical protein